MSMTYFVYLLRSDKNGRLYIGLTTHLEQRLQEHNQGKVKSTKGYLPYSIIHLEKFDTQTIARKRELFFKTGKGKKVINNIINGEVA